MRRETNYDNCFNFRRCLKNKEKNIINKEKNIINKDINIINKDINIINKDIIDKDKDIIDKDILKPEDSFVILMKEDEFIMIN